jgi:membrane-associated phospholipid phosphatase
MPGRCRGRGRRAALSCVAAAGLSLAAAGAYAQAPAAAPPDPAPNRRVPDERVPIEANFSPAERVTTLFVGVTGVIALAVAPTWYTPDAPSLGAPAPGSFDRRISESLYLADGRNERFLWGIPDVTGIFMLPYVPALYYGAETFWLRYTGRTLLEGGNVNADHHLWAYIEALGWTALISGVTKILVGRPRPYAVLGHPELAFRGAREENLSFYSGHAAAMFCAASFVALDVSDRLRRGPLREAGGFQRLVLGTLAPYAAAYGLAGLVGVSRIIDQQHWASDVVMGGVLGAGAAHLAYVTHFDAIGRPRRRLGADALDTPGAFSFVPIPGGIALRGLLP